MRRIFKIRRIIFYGLIFETFHETSLQSRWHEMKKYKNCRMNFCSFKIIEIQFVGVCAIFFFKKNFE